MRSHCGMLTLPLLVLTIVSMGCHGAYKWIPAQNGQIPAGAVLGGWEDVCPLYVGRGVHGNGLIPGKICPSIGTLFVADDGEEHQQLIYEVLVSDDAIWIPSSGGREEPGAISGGYSAEAKKLYIGRCWTETKDKTHRSLAIGKVYPGSKLFVPLYGKEQACENYEVLVDKTYANASILSTLKRLLSNQQSTAM